MKFFNQVFFEKRFNCLRTENIIIEKVTSWLSDDKTIDRMADDVMALLSEENEMIPALEAQLKQVRSSIDNIMKAIEQGVVTRTTRSRLEELEHEEESLTANIKAEEAKKPKISKEFILFTLDKFRKLDLRIEKNKERLIDGLVKAIIVYDDRFEVFLTFDDTPITIPTSEEIESMKNSSDIASVTSPTKKDGFCRPFLLLIRLDKSDPLKPARGGLERVCAQVSEEV